MGIIVEDGSGLADANSYTDEATLDDYTDARGIVLSSGDAEAALIRASIAIDARYANSYPGYRKSGRDQGLQWPRSAAYDIGGWLIRDDQVPLEIIQATCEAAIRELADPNSMMPDLERGGGIESIKAGSVSITYAANASSKTTFTLIDGIINNILSGMGGSNGGLFGSAVRS